MKLNKRTKYLCFVVFSLLLELLVVAFFGSGYFYFYDFVEPFFSSASSYELQIYKNFLFFGAISVFFGLSLSGLFLSLIKCIVAVIKNRKDKKQCTD